MSEFRKFMEEEIYDIAAADSVNITDIHKTTMNNLLSVFQGESNPNDALRLLLMYIARQIGRGGIERQVGVKMMRSLRNIHERFSQNPEELRAAVMKYLTILKWIYDSKLRVPRDVRSFKQLIDSFITGLTR